MDISDKVSKTNEKDKTQIKGSSMWKSIGVSIIKNLIIFPCAVLLFFYSDACDANKKRKTNFLILENLMNSVEKYNVSHFQINYHKNDKLHNICYKDHLELISRDKKLKIDYFASSNREDIILIDSPYFKQKGDRRTDPSKYSKRIVVLEKEKNGKIKIKNPNGYAIEFMDDIMPHDYFGENALQLSPGEKQDEINKNMFNILDEYLDKIKEDAVPGKNKLGFDICTTTNIPNTNPFTNLTKKRYFHQKYRNKVKH